MSWDRTFTVLLLLAWHVVCAFETSKEPLLVLPFQYVGLLQSNVPREFAPLVAPKYKKREQWLKLASVLIAKCADESSARTVAFLVDLTTKLDNHELPDLLWHESLSTNMDLINARTQPCPKVLAKLAPAMMFRAVIQQPRHQ